MFENHNQKKKITALAFSAIVVGYHFENTYYNTRETLLKRCNTSSASFILKYVTFL